MSPDRELTPEEAEVMAMFERRCTHPEDPETLAEVLRWLGHTEVDVALGVRRLLARDVE